MPSAYYLIPQNFVKDDRNLRMILYQSMSAVRVISTLKGGWDTRTLTAILKFIWTFLHSEVVGCYNIALVLSVTFMSLAPSRCSHQWATWWNFSLPNIFLYRYSEYSALNFDTFSLGRWYSFGKILTLTLTRWHGERTEDGPGAQ